MSKEIKISEFKDTFGFNVEVNITNEDDLEIYQHSEDEPNYIFLNRKGAQALFDLLYTALERMDK